MAAVLMPLTLVVSPASAADPEAFTLDLVEGQLALRGGDPFALEGPTTLSGSNSDGQLTDVVLATPPVTSTRPVPEYNTSVTITASFSTVQPGIGSINDDGSMTVQLRLGVDLHLVVVGLPDPSDCRAAPINITLTSTTPYDGESVTLRAPNFTVPPVAASSTCNGLLVDPVNEALAGSGHALTLTLAGAITPPAAGQPTATTLVVTPEGGTRIGSDATLVATVVPAPAVPGAPAVTGIVTYFDGSTSLGTADVGEDGTATLTTSSIPAGSRQLRAVYGGAPPDWKPSESVVVPHRVTADPAVTTTAAGEVRVGGPGKDFDVAVVNTGFGAELADARLEVEIRRQTGTATIAPVGSDPRIALSRVVEGVATPVSLTYSGGGANQRLAGTVGDPGTWLVPPGQEHVEALRLDVAAGTAVGPLAIAFTLVTGDGAARTVLATTTGVVTMVTEARQETTIAAGVNSPIPQIPGRPPITPEVRQGNVAQLNALVVNPTISAGVTATGTYTFAVDGVPVLGQHTGLTGEPDPFTWLETVPKAGSEFLIKVPADTPIGVRQVTVRYSGDALYAPSQANFPVTILPSAGTVYECMMVAGLGLQRTRFTANVEVQATLPRVWAAGQDLPVDRVRVRIRVSRTGLQQLMLSDINNPATEQDLRLDLGPNGLISPAEVTGSNAAPLAPGQTGPPDQIVDLTGGTGTIAVPSAPGEQTSYTLDRLVVSGTTNTAQGAFAVGFTCTPGEAAYTLGAITSAGTSLAVDPAGPVGSGRAVALTATALPAASGVVEFRDGSTTIGVVPVNAAGVATMSTTTLPAGARSLNARFFGGPVATSPSASVELRVVGDCAANLDPGNGAAVRLVYMELLNRCPDQAGYDFWTERLDTGAVTREQFALEISKSLEARGVIVDSGYRMMLDRAAEPAGRDFWARRLANGRYDDLLGDLAASPEYWSQAGGTNTGFVELTYQRILRRPAEPDGLAYWTDRLDRGQSRRQLVLTLFNLSEPLGVVVADAYDDLLGRSPSADERAHGVTLMRSTSNRSRLYAVVIDTDDFFNRAQEFPERS